MQADRPAGTLPPVWRFFGADEPNYATMKDGRKLLVELGKLKSGEVFFRAHNLLSTGDGTPAFKWGSTNAYTETKDGKPVYDWTIVDGIIDTYLARGVRPYLQIGFMPEATYFMPSRTIAWASTVAVVVPSPATSLVAVATSRTSWAPWFWKTSSTSISRAMVTPSFVIVGAPNFLSRTT